MKVSFCIPTYNHGRFLGAALESILAQAPPDFEIVIVDGASKDETPEVVALYQARSNAIVYRRMAENRGVDPDIAEALATASGDYLWLMSSDDVLAEGAVQKVMRALQRGNQLYIGTRTECTEEMSPFRNNPVLAAADGQVWDFSRETDLLAFLRGAQGLIGLFSYISVLVVERQLWSSVADAAEYYGSCYAHAYRLWHALERRGVVEFLQAPIVMARMGTDNFSSRGVFRRFMLDFDGYVGIADAFFSGRPLVRKEFLAAVRREHSIFRLAKFYHGCTDASQRMTARKAVRAAGYPQAVVWFMCLIGSGGVMVTTAVALRRIIRRGLGRLRHSGV